MDEKFVIESDFTLKSRTDMVRAFMGKVYYGFLLVAGAVICFNYYLISSGRAAAGDERKTLTLFILMIIWAFIPVISGFIWNSISKVKHIKITVNADKITTETNCGTFELTPDRFYTIIEREHYIKLGPLKQTVIINTKDVSCGEGNKIADFLRDMH